MKKSDFFFVLPEELIAQVPLKNREQSKLLTLDKHTGETTHKHFYEIIDMLKPNDCLILNDTKVIPARLYGIKDSGAKVEFLLLTRRDDDTWECLCGPGKKAKRGDSFVFIADRLSCIIKEVLDNGNRIIAFNYTGDFYSVLSEIGELPLPHYIKEPLTDKDRYNTVYANYAGSAAAPTAGLHFTQSLLKSISEKGISIGYVTLHVGIGTFRPVKEDDITNHIMHTEHYSLPQATADIINHTKASGGRVIAVGTTSARTLETVASLGEMQPAKGDTGIFIYPGYSFKCVDALITNFHLPESTLIMLVSALAGREATLQAYNTAVQNGYRFYSFGDAMFIS